MRIIMCAILLSLSLSGCSRISIHTDPDLKGPETGIKFYTPKPYVLVKRTGAKTKPVEIEVVYLPDLENPLYAKATSGIGSSKLELSFQNGILSTFGQEADPKITDLISTLAGVPKSLAEAGKIKADAAAVRAQASSVDITNAGNAVGGIVNDFDRFLEKPTTPDITSDNQRKKLERLSIALLQHSKSLLNPGAESRLLNTVKGLEGAAKQLAKIVPADGQNLTEPGKAFWGMIAASKNTLSDSIKRLKPKGTKPTPPPTLTLYEIISTPTGTQLREVKIK